MTQPPKRRYEIDLTIPRPTPVEAQCDVRLLTREDRDSLARLMLDAYEGTIDYEGETIVEAREAVDDWLEDAPLLEHSFGADVAGRLASAILLMTLDDAPFIAIVMTAPEHKGSGIARTVTETALTSLGGAGHRRVALYITEGNTPSERLFGACGARFIDEG